MSINYNNYRENCENCENSDDRPICAYFTDIQAKLIGRIRDATYVIGCTAWLTNLHIIDALESKRGVKIIVNKEEFLNPRLTKGQSFHYGCVRGAYGDMNDLAMIVCLCCNKPTSTCPNYLNVIGTRLHDVPIEGSILACGTVNNWSKMHHKFLVFFDDAFRPTGVWTGSYNFSNNSNNSLENAMYVTDPDITREYIKEFLTVYLISEKYNWTSCLLKDSRHLAPS